MVSGRDRGAKVNELAMCKVDHTCALAWARSCLDQGSDLSTSVSRVLADFSIAEIVARPEIPVRHLAQGQGMPAGRVDLIANHRLMQLSETGLRTLIVEDELARRGDPIREEDVAFVGDRVLRWLVLSSLAHEPARLLRSGSAGYPLNAFILSGSPETLGLNPRRGLDDVSVQEMASHVVSLVFAICDGESFLFLSKKEI